MSENELCITSSKRIGATFLDCLFSLALTLAFFIILNLLISDFIAGIRPYFSYIICFIWIAIPMILELLPKRQTLGKMAYKIYVEPKASRLYPIKIIFRNLLKYSPVILLASIIQDGIDIKNYFLLMLVYRFIGVLKLGIALTIVVIDLVVMNVSASGSSLHDGICGTMVVKK